MTRPKEDGGVALTGDQDPQLLGRSDAPEALLSADSGEQFKIESWRVRVLRILIDCSENTRTLDRLEPRKRLKKFRVEAQFFRNSRGHQFNVADETCVDPGSLAQRQEISPLEEPVDFVGLPAFFIEFLTEPGDVVLDPFAGSNVTGEAAETLGRSWISCDLDADREQDHSYVRASAFRFEEADLSKAFDFTPAGDWGPKARNAK